MIKFHKINIIKFYYIFFYNNTIFFLIKFICVYILNNIKNKIVLTNNYRLNK